MNYTVNFYKDNELVRSVDCEFKQLIELAVSLSVMFADGDYDRIVFSDHRTLPEVWENWL